MIRNRVPTRLWDYEMRWVTDVMSLTHNSARDIAVGYFYGGIPLNRVTGETADISEYLDFGFMIKSSIKIILALALSTLTDGLVLQINEKISCVTMF